jgi:hypothetical protein
MSLLSNYRPISGHYQRLCHIGRCINPSDSRCPACRKPVCGEHVTATDYTCLYCFRQAVKEEIQDVNFD